MNTKILQLAGCIILDEKGRILLLHRNTANRQQWEIPGGKIEPGESAEQAAIREIQEELGVDVEIVKLLGQKEFKEESRTMNYAWFLAEITSGKLLIIETEIFDQLRYLSHKELEAITTQLSPVLNSFLEYNKLNKSNFTRGGV